MVSRDHLPSRFLPELRLASRPALLVLITILFVGPGAALRHWQSGSRAESADFRLPPAASSLKLDDTGAARLESQPAPALVREGNDNDLGPSQPIVVGGEEKAADTGDNSAPAGGYQLPDPATEPPKLETTEFVAHELSAPQAFDDEAFRYPQPGETPMIRNWKMLGLQTILAAALAAAPTSAYADPPKEGQDKPKVSLEDLKKSLDSIQKDMDKFSALSVNVDRIDEEVKKLKDQVAQLQRDVESLGKSRTAFYRGPAAGTSQVRLENAFPADMTIVVNQIPYRLAPNQSRIVSLPAGPFIYEVPTVPGFRPRQIDLAANETFSIQVFPQQPPAAIP